MIDTSLPVRLRERPEMTGMVTSVGKGLLTIAFDGGGTGNFRADAIEQHDGQPNPDGKQWPPRLERK